MSACENNVITKTYNIPTLVHEIINGRLIYDLARNDVLYTLGDRLPVAVDLAARVFQVCYQGSNGHLKNEKLSYADFETFISKSKGNRLYIMEGCSSSSSWANLIKKRGDEVILVNPITTHCRLLASGQFKDDRNDAAHLWQASFMPFLRTCRIRTEEELHYKSMFRIRQQAKKALDVAVNETRALLIEILAYNGHQIKNSQSALTAIEFYCCRKDANPTAVFNLQMLSEDIRHLQRKLDMIDYQAERFVKRHKGAKLLLTIPGVGPLTAAAMIIAIGDISNFKSARQLRAYLGIVTSHTGSGGKIIMGRLSTAGDKALKGILYEGAQAIMKECQFCIKRRNLTPEDARSNWLYENAMRKTNGYKKRIIRVMAKIVSICYGVLASGKPYDDKVNNCLGGPKVRIKTQMKHYVRKNTASVKKSEAKAKAKDKAKDQVAEQAPVIKTIPVSDMAAAELGL